MMEINRRDFLGLSALAMASPITLAKAANTPAPLYASTRKEANGHYSGVIFHPSVGDVATVTMPERGHDIAVHPLKKEVVIFARRPDTFAVVLSVDNKKLPYWFRSKGGRHFYGHGVFSADGKYLYTTENDYENGTGKIGIRLVSKQYRQIGETSSYGIGPHDLGMLSDGKTLVIANGGMETHPDAGREILNLPTMKPNISYIDIKTGTLIEKHELPHELHQLSIRHMDIGIGDRVIFGCQYKGDISNRPMLVGIHKMGQKPIFLEAPQDDYRVMQNYIGSIAVDSSGTIAAATSPKGGATLFWDIEAQQFLGKQLLVDNCGLASADAKGEFLITNGQGVLAKASPQSLVGLTSKYKQASWDNHAVKIR